VLTATTRLGPPMVRAGSRSPLPVLPVLIALPVVYSVVRGLGDLDFAVTLTAIIGAACLAYAVEERGEQTLDACPVSRAARRSVRAALVLTAVAVGWVTAAIALLLAERSPGPLRMRIPETVAVAAIALAVACRTAAAGSDAAGTVGATASLIGVGVSTGLAVLLPWLPQLQNPFDRTQWNTVALVAFALAAWWSRDPASPSVGWWWRRHRDRASQGAAIDPTSTPGPEEATRRDG
jgi:hypothetical protein